MTDPRRQRTRQALLDAGLALFAELPVDAVAIDEVTAKAGVGKGSFYNHFASREAFATAIVEDIRRDIEQKILAANYGIAAPATRVARAIMLYADYAMKMPQQALVIGRSDPMQRFDHELNDNMIADIKQGVAEGVFSVGSIEAGKLFLVGGVGMLILRLAREKNASLAREICLEMCTLFLCCLGLDRADAVGQATSAQRSLLEQNIDVHSPTNLIIATS
jgi:AcrR family transcriptional regulator